MTEVSPTSPTSNTAPLTLEQAGENSKTIEHTREDSNDPFLIFEGHEDYDTDDEQLRGRQKHDVFHRFQALLVPMNKNDPRRSIISRLLIHSTFEFDIDDLAQIESHLQNAKNFDPADANYYDKLPHERFLF